ncbi:MULTISPECIES: hypothetical protein [unclassified Pseudomonas]|uniref:hypothetical protein n=1 Tax=Pseudomonas TaxID=286 RepID=UPI002160CDB9|nr:MULTISPECIES: hypothetical protein [unclassified Pseudomonas]UVL54737.1 hypothetical protein LOY22_17960 [Pseudomonas sp. B21-035]UVM65295.1 hypothetical protein LOY34_18400 [Pseudomonas sp. B21-009]
MIEDIESLMKHWGEQQARFGHEASLGSQMGSIVDWKGGAPRGTPGTRPLIGGGSGMDYAAAEVDAAIAELERRDERGQALAKLARFRYHYGAPIREQMREVGLAEGADRTYRNWVQALHLRVMTILMARQGVVHGRTVRRSGMAQSGAKVVSKSGRS